jgi:hypothetical protein
VRRSFPCPYRPAPRPAHPASCTSTMACGTGSFLAVKVRQGVAEHPSPFSTEVANGLQLYSRPPPPRLCLHRYVTGWPWPFIYPHKFPRQQIKTLIFLCGVSIGRLVLRYIDHTQLHTHPTGFLWKSDQPVAEAATYIKHKRRTSMSSARFEPAIPAIKQLQTYALECTATGIGI